jgi:uncharacterized protein YndB with AHSA1/START domain
MLKIAGFVLVAVVAAILGHAALRPDSFRIERSATIQAPPERVFAQVNELRAWTAWSPWETIDPQLQRTYSGPPAGEGAAYVWKGNRDVGAGRMEIVESQPGARIVIKLDFLDPIEAHNTAEFSFARDGGGTRVIWAMYGPSPYLSKLLDLVFNMDRMVGDQFETGLSNLKSVIER